MTAEIAPLGFEIDTSALTGAQKAAEQTAASLDKMGVAAEKAGTKTKQAAQGVDQAATATKNAGAAAGAAADGMGKFGKGTEAAGKSAVSAGMNVKQLMEVLKQSQGHVAGSGQAIQNLTGQLGAMAQTIGQGGSGGLSGSLTSSVGLLGRLGSTLGPVGGLVAGVAGGVAALGAAFSGVVTVSASVQERFALLEARLKNVYGSANTAKMVFADITALANKNAVAIDQTAEAYLRLARNNNAIGLSRREMVQLTDTVQMLGRVSGASTGELASGMMQFSQALASGRLNGDELRSIMENMPALAKAIADGMKISVGQLRAMGAEGQLTGDKITKALLGQTEKIQKEFEGLPQTSEQAFTRVGNAWDTMLERIGKKINSTGVLQWVARAAEDIIKATDRTLGGETSNQIIDRNRSIMNSNNWDQGTRNAAAARVRNEQYGAWARGQDARAEAERELVKEQSRQPSARWEQGKRVLEDVDPVQKKVKELTANLAQLKQMWADFQNNPKLLPEGAEEQAARLPRLIEQMKLQLESALPAFEKFRKTTADSISDAIKYGYQGAGFGGDVRKLMESGVSEGAAVGAVTEKRIFDTNSETDAINKQIEAQRLRIAAIGQGKAAEREAEASIKALDYQYRTFGTTLTGPAKAAVEAYRVAVLGLSTAQDMAANKQAMLSAQIDLAAAKAGAAVAAAGGNSGAVAAAQRNARRAGQLSTSDDPASMAVRFAAEDIDRSTSEAGQLRRSGVETAMQRRIARGMSPAEAHLAQQRQEARQFSETFSPDQQELAYQTKMTELRAKDAASIRQQIDQKEQAADLTRQEIELTAKGGLAAQVAIARARELNAIRAAGLKLTDEEVAKRLQLAEQAVIDADALSKAQRTANAYVKMWEDAGQAITSGLEGQFSKLLDGEKFKMQDFLQSITKDVAMAVIRAQITSPIANAFSDMGNGGGGKAAGGLAMILKNLLSSMLGIFGGGGTQANAFGNVFAGGYSVTAFGGGGLLSSPTLFPMARGAGLAGEAGAEAILPLKRGPDGKLGVGGGQRSESGTQVIVNDMRSGGQQVESQEDRGPDGRRLIRLTIRDEVKGQMKNGSYDPEMRSQYGASRQLARR